MDSNLLSSVEQLQTAVELIMNPQTPSHLRREASDVSSSGVKQSSPTKHRIGRIDRIGHILYTYSSFSFFFSLFFFFFLSLSVFFVMHIVVVDFPCGGRTTHRRCAERWLPFQYVGCGENVHNAIY